MTHPLTPHEKVARIVDPKAFDHPAVHPQHLVARRAVSFSKADAILTALASGSGDHAELARLAEAAAPYWHAANLACGGNPIAVDLVAPFVGAMSPAVCSALLAENAALRASLTKANDGFEEYERKFYLEQDAREEAERKLAEADKVIREISETAQITRVRHLARTFLSKEAERG